MRRETGQASSFFGRRSRRSKADLERSSTRPLTEGRAGHNVYRQEERHATETLRRNQSAHSHRNTGQAAFKQEKEQDGEDRHTACHKEKNRAQRHTTRQHSHRQEETYATYTGTLRRTRATRSSLSLTIERRTIRDRAGEGDYVGGTYSRLLR